MGEHTNEAMRYARWEEAPNDHPLNPAECFGCGRTFDSGELGYTGPLGCYCGICIIAALDKVERVRLRATHQGEIKGAE